MPKIALLVVDVQNDFCPGGALAAENGDEVVEPLNRMIAYAQEQGWLVLTSRDWHPEETTHFEEYGGPWPRHCVEKTEGAAFHPDLNTENAIVISKGMDPGAHGYSAFDGETNEGVALADFLKQQGIEELYVGGLTTEYCVKNSAKDARRNGLDVFLLKDAVRPVRSEDEPDAIEEMKGMGIRVTTTEAVLGKE